MEVDGEEGVRMEMDEEDSVDDGLKYRYDLYISRS